MKMLRPYQVTPSNFLLNFLLPGILKLFLFMAFKPFSPWNRMLELTIPDTMYVDLSSFWLWEAAVVVIIEPFSKPVMGLVQQKFKHLSLRLGMRRSFFLYCVLCYLYTFWMYYSYLRAVDDQLYSLKLTENNILILGYIFLFGGILLKVYAYRKYGLVTIMGGEHFDLPVQPESRYHPYYHPAGTATLACLFGFSAVRASRAGLLLLAVHIVAYHLAFFFERHHLKKV